MAEEIKQASRVKKLSFSPVFLTSLILLAVAVGLGIALTKEKAEVASLKEQLNSAVSIRTRLEKDLKGLQEENEGLKQELEEAQVKIEDLARQLTVLQVAPVIQEEGALKTE